MSIYLDDSGKGESVGHIYSEGIPGAQSVTLAGADHLLPLRVPKQLHPLLLEHLAN